MINTVTIIIAMLIVIVIQRTLGKEPPEPPDLRKPQEAPPNISASHAVLCRALCCAVLCFAVLCCAML